MKNKIRIGCGAGFSGDRIEPAIVLAEKGKLDYLVLECLAERTIALANKRKMADPTKGYDPLLERRIETLLPHLVKNNIRLITNMGAANPTEGAKKIIEIAKKQGVTIKVAAVSGDDVSEKLKAKSERFSIFGNENFAIDLIDEYQSPFTHHLSPIVSANAYLGVDGILEALQANAQIIITGRVADPSLFLAPMIHEFGWATDDYDLMGKGTVIGHLMECAGHITGGYFADPIKKPVENMDNLGHPFADIFADGSAVISKVEGTGGIINLQTAKEQLLYEVINPNEYYTPDVVADFTSVKLEEIAQNQVRVTGGSGKEKPSTYKVSVGYKAFWQGEGEISYAGPAAYERAKLAGETVEKRLKSQFEEIQVDLIGINSTFGNRGFDFAQPPISEAPISEVRLRVAAKAQTQADAALIGEEIEALYTNGPAGGGGVRKYVNEVIGIVSVLVDRKKVFPQVTLFEAIEINENNSKTIAINNTNILIQNADLTTIKQEILPHRGAGGLLYDIAHSRAGDKGNISTLSLIPYDESDYAMLCEKVSTEKVKQHFAGIIEGEIIRYEMPNISSLLFVCHDALAGGVTTSLRIDTHGKSLSYKLLEMEI